MNKLRKTVYTILFIIAVILAIATILSVFRDTENRYLKMLDFPRIQFFIVSIISLVVMFIINKKWKWYDYLLLTGLLAGAVINGTYLINYTPLVTEEVPTTSASEESSNTFSLLIVNVKMKNDKTQPLINLLQEKNPDIILAMEVNSSWQNELNKVTKNYTYSRKVINDVAYGMTLYSKFPLIDVLVNYLNNKNVPSIESTVQLPSGEKFRFFSVHPVPPTHFKKYPDNVGQDEVEMKKIGRKVTESKLPNLVAGDLNDVVWSHVDKLTGTDNILNDVRVGRGFYTSFNAKNFLTRWPLDHIFVTKEFSLQKLERLPKIGSDHFPMYVELVLKNN